MANPKRKIIQLEANPDLNSAVFLYALCDDGTVWKRRYDTEQGITSWKRIDISDVEES